MQTSEVIGKHITLNDGSTVVARFFAPHGAARAAVLLPAAMGVTQRFYEPFARWLARQGYLAATFDYRGIGASSPKVLHGGSLRDLRVNITDWANDDCATMLAQLKQRAPQLPLYVIGHSLGAQLLGLIPNRELIDGVIIVASGSGYWRTTAPATMRSSIWLWYVAAPVLTSICGYFPGKVMRAVGDLPRGVMTQWRRWCLHPEYCFGAEGPAARAAFASITAPMLSLSFADDDMMSITSTEALHRFYGNASIEHTRIAPSDVGGDRIGHFGFFRPKFEQSLWPMAANWIAARL